MNPWLYSIPLVSALIGWLFNRAVYQQLLNRYLPARKNAIAAMLGEKAGQLLPFSKIEEKIGDAALVEKAMPMIESHIDEFLTVKLPQEIPMLAMFVGNKTTDKIKEVFITQLRALFPKVMGTLVKDLKNTLDIKLAVENEFAKIDIAALLKEKLSGTSRQFALAGLLLGLLTGLLNLLLFYILA
ncbi:hypothetical protein U0035_02960 [Niabella yanshanensis]|uniref:DUF445 family protein n=1 Tax=Niabella yanshanensis TaxID=577386 RepID=A0ABZ0W7I5_9BACT|nr:hypothetical protein [Niabella yanshanensis]WQD39106.1 hypothetical protein U0035_02960 [Niabella yanshanensis]